MKTALKTLTATLAGIGATALVATAAHADPMEDTSMTAETATVQSTTMTRTVKTIDADGNVSMKTVSVVPTDRRRTAVMSAFAVQNTDAYIVADADGDLYINHLIPVAELPSPVLSVETIDTYSYEYQGRTFTNRIVTEE